MTDPVYPGRELELFAGARHWKEYWSAHIRPFVRGDVLEVGAGIGGNLPFLDRGERGRWVCLEPDVRLAGELRGRTAAIAGRRYEIVGGTLAATGGQRFDTILYVDVLEHIQDDAAELVAAAAQLRAGGHLIVLSPAYQALWSPFDEAVGHFRRYDRRRLLRAAPPGLQVCAVRFLDSAGILAPAANRVLRRRVPSRLQIALWDRGLVPLSRMLDGWLNHSAGRSIVAIWRA